MNVSPLDLRQQSFHSRFRGFDRTEVTSFLAAVADDYEQALRETDRLKQDIASMETALKEHREHDKNLRATLTTAQKLSDDIKASADLEAQRIIREADGRRRNRRPRDSPRKKNGIGRRARRCPRGAPGGATSRRRCQRGDRRLLRRPSPPSSPCRAHRERRTWTKKTHRAGRSDSRDGTAGRESRQWYVKAWRGKQL